MTKRERVPIQGKANSNKTPFEENIFVFHLYSVSLNVSNETKFGISCTWKHDVILYHFFNIIHSAIDEY